MKECVRLSGVLKMFFIRIISLLVLSTAGVLAAADAPPSVTATAATCSSVNVTWQAASGNGGNAPAQYDVFRDTANNLIGSVSSSSLSYSDSAAGSYSTHTYGVRTKASNGSLSSITWSASVSTSAQCPGPGAPQNLSAATPSCTQVSLSWTAPTQTGSGLVGYRVYRNNVYITQVTGVGYANSGLAQNTTYTYDVSAMDSGGRESAKTRVVVTTPSCQAQGPTAGPPGAANLAISGPNNFVSWPGTTGVRYQAEYSSDFGITWSPADAPTTAFGATHARVGSTVMYRVAWFTNTAEYKNNYSLFASDGTAPNAISTYNATELTGGQIRLDWSATSDTQAGVKGYLLYRDNAFLAFTPNGVTTYTDATGQGVNSTYDIAAMDRAGNVTAKVRPNCTFSLSSSGWTAPACAGSTSVYVTASRSSCAWSVSNPCAWLTVTPGGNGSGWVNISATGNTSGSARSCTLNIAGQSFSITQSACACNYTITTSSSPAAGGSTSGGGTVNCGSSVTVNASANSGYTFANWTENGGIVSSSASYVFTASANRNLVANFTANPCSFSLVPSSSSFGNSGGSGSFIVYTTSGCSRTATPSGGWITVTGGGSGSGNGTVYFSVAANTGAARSGTITISGSGPSQTYTISQDAAASCNYSLTPTNVYFSSTISSGSSIVNAGAGCGWTATALDGWVSVTSGTSGSGSGTVAYSVNSNPSVALDRVGRIRVVGGSVTNILTINQDRNYAPVPSAGGSSSGSVGAAISMDGSGSTDEDGVIVSYAWNYGDGGNGSGVTASHAYAAVGTYTVTLTTTDDLGASSSASKVVTVSASTGNPGELDFVRGVTSPTGMHVYSRGVAGDSAGNSISVGYFTGSADFGAGTVNSAGSADAFVAKYDAQGGLRWARTLSSTLDQTAYAVAVDSADNIYVTGYFYGTVDFGGTVLTSVGGSDIYLAKYSSAGSLVWVKRFGGGTTDMSYGVAVDSNNNAVIVGYFQGTGDFGSFSLTSAGGSIDIALVKVSATGTVTWAKRYGGSYVEYPNGIAVDTAGDVVITGQAGVGGSSTDLGGGNLTGSGIFIAKYAGATGNHSWSKVLGGNVGYSVTCDPNTRNVIVTGCFQGNVNFGGGSVAPGAGGGQTMFLAGYSPTGAYLWVNTWGGAVSTSYDQGMAVRVNSAGNVILTGTITSPIDFGGGMLFGGGYFIASYSVSGNSPPAYRWAKRSTGFGAATGFGCGFDSSGNVLTSGYYNQTVDFGGIPITAYGANNAFLCHYAP